jgi:DNA-binding transcriptional regulator YiaG
MTPAEYKTARKERGTQQGVAALLGVDYHTIQRRESGEIKITREAEIALLALRRKRLNVATSGNKRVLP